MFLGIFIIRYHLELILSIPLIAGFFSMYLRIALKPDSAAQAPERLFKEAGLMVYLVLCVAVFVLLMFVRISFSVRMVQRDSVGLAGAVGDVAAGGDAAVNCPNCPNCPTHA